MSLLIMLALAVQAAPAPPPCTYDRAAMMALDEQAFDQDMAGGWRAVSAVPGCDLAGADLIRDRRAAHPEASRPWLSFWHEGQLRANAGQTREAVSLFRRSHRPRDPGSEAWNLYVDGSIAFLTDDRPGLEAARATLAALPRPADWTMKGPDGREMPAPWPMNLNVLDGFRRCWGKTYVVAYGPVCSAPVSRVEVRAR